jgi:hypothetical protein
MANAFVDGFLNTMLDAGAAILDQVSLHTAYSNTGTNEVTGGSYARQAITWNAASAGALDSSNAPSFSVPSGNTIRFVGFWDAAPSPDTFQGMIPNQQAADVSPIRFVVDTGNDTIEAPAHGLVTDDGVVFVGGTAPGGLTEGTVYYVSGETADDFQVQAVKGTSPASPITLTNQGDMDVRFWQIREETFASDGTFNLNDVDLDFFT